MPKLKTSKSAAKRFRLTGKGKVKRTRSGKSHLMVTFSGKRVSRLRKSALVCKAEEKKIKRMLLA
ncbi:MAG: 50S ribosomal protein L35 [Planctomycetes bacterium]|nr:50S ribosomal protein L35 [Planctomycetota bacterium]